MIHDGTENNTDESKINKKLYDLAIYVRQNNIRKKSDFNKLESKYKNLSTGILKRKSNDSTVSKERKVTFNLNEMVE